MAEQDQLAQVQARVQADPRVLAIINDRSTDLRGKMYRLSAIQRELAQDGTLPPGYMIDPDGRVSVMDGWTFKDWALKVGIPVGSLGVGAYMGAFGAPGTNAAAASAGAPAATEAAIFGSDAAKASAATAGVGTGANAVMNGASNAATRLGGQALESTSDRLLSAALSAMAGLPAALSNRGPSEEERGYTAQATRLLGQQEQRTQFQSPLYEAATRMAFGLLPNMGNNGQPYPYQSLSDVKVPGLEDVLRTAQRRT